jgi:hypothetical protein
LDEKVSGVEQPEDDGDDNTSRHQVHAPARWPGIGHRSGEPQCQLTVRTEMAVDECRYRRRQLMPGEIEAAQNFPSDILRGIPRPMFGGIECDDPNRVAVLAGHQVVDGSFEIGLAEIGLRECGTRFPVIVDDEIKSLIVAVRHNRRARGLVVPSNFADGPVRIAPTPDDAALMILRRYCT